MAEVLGFQQRTRTELAEATHAAAAALARASRAEGLAAEANAVTTTHASQTRERLGDLEGRFTALAAAQLHAGEAMDVVVDALVCSPTRSTIASAAARSGNARASP